MNKTITYVTGNWAKIDSAKQILEPLGYTVDNIKIETNLTKELTAPIFKNQKVGNIKIYLNEKVINEYVIKTKNEVKELDFKFCFVKLLKLIATI